jgi:hypothetical protein
MVYSKHYVIRFLIHRKEYYWEDARYMFDEMCACHVLVPAYCSDHNVAVHQCIFLKGLTKLGADINLSFENRLPMLKY